MSFTCNLYVYNQQLNRESYRAPGEMGKKLGTVNAC